MVRYQPPTEWQQWVDWLAAVLHGRNRWRLAVVVMGILFARGRRTVTTWLRAAGIQEDFHNYYHFLNPLGRKAKALAERLLTWLRIRLHKGDHLLFAVDDSLTNSMHRTKSFAESFWSRPRGTTLS